MQIVKWKEAKEQGLTTYFTGKPCRNGHVVERFTSCRECVQCRREKKRIDPDDLINLPITDEELRAAGGRKWKVWRQRYAKRFPEKIMWRAAKDRAKRLNLEFDIQPEDIVIPEVCPVLGIPLDVGKATRWTAPSLDRFDSSKGYTKDNIRVISHRANFLKNNAEAWEIEAVLKYMKATDGVKYAPIPQRQ